MQPPAREARGGGSLSRHTEPAAPIFHLTLLCSWPRGCLASKRACRLSGPVLPSTREERNSATHLGFCVWQGDPSPH